MIEQFTIGIDFGTDSARMVLIDALNGELINEVQSIYNRWAERKYCIPEINQFRQHPLDYIESLNECFGKLSKHSNKLMPYVKGISAVTTGSTPCPVDKLGVPLALNEKFKDNPNAMFHLWKDHTAVKEAEEFNLLSAKWGGVDYRKYQGEYSSEWYWAKILHTIRTDGEIKNAAYSWFEHCDWITGLLAGKTKPAELYHSSCAAGHKALWHSEYGGLPDESFLMQLDPYLADIRKVYGRAPEPATARVGVISKEFAEKYNINPLAVIGGSSFDAHAGGVGVGIKENTMVEIIGTSTVDLLIEKKENLAGKCITDFCGQAEDSIMPGYIGIEAGQAAFGDIYAWFKNLLMWPVRNIIINSQSLDNKQKQILNKEIEEQIIPNLIKQCFSSNEKNKNIIALDWFNGRRYPYINEEVKSVISGLDLSSNAVDIFKGLIMGTIFGSKRIIESLCKSGLEINKVIVAGGIPHKSGQIVQALADVLQVPIDVAGEQQACARGAAIYAAVASGSYTEIPEAQNHMVLKPSAVYFPDKLKSEYYSSLYKKYKTLGELTNKNYTKFQ